MVRVDNGVDRQIIPSQKADFVLYGGLTRDVYLRVRPETYISSIHINTPAVSSRSASVSANIEIQQTVRTIEPLQLVLEVKDKTGEVVANAETEVEPGTGLLELQLEMPEISNPALWSPALPNLYTLHATLKDQKGAVVHGMSERFGLRWFGFADNGSLPGSRRARFDSMGRIALVSWWFG